MTPVPFTLRPYTEADEARTIELWRRTWQIAYPSLDFNVRVDWWRERWREELLPAAKVVVAERASEIIGFVTVEPDTGYLDQIVVAPEAWADGIGAKLLDEAKRIAPRGIDLHVNTDNNRAIRFYEKHGFAVSGNDKNYRSGAPIYKMSWRAPSA